MWIEVDSNKQGIKSWVASEHVERCDVNETLEPPFAALTMRSGMICYISDVQSMKKLQRVMGVDLPRAGGL
ncbi:MAG TPA: hypothetical protein VNS19_20890 [Acidimicrobiales bacterium]|jgi:hypothetical protein|nr:hypothetical protein [Acidimicrobiales bacterium]